MINRTPTVSGIVVIPARNESSSVGEVVQHIKKHVEWTVLVVDDSSTDTTASEAERNDARVLRLPFRVGAWGAIQTGMAYALDEDYEFCLTIDADGQHPAEALLAVADPVVCGASDVSIGVCPERVSRARYAAWIVFKRITGLDLQDVTSGMRAYNAQAMNLLTGSDAAMLNYQDIGVLLMLREAGMHVAEIGVDMDVRKNGRSRVYDSWWTVIRYLIETFVLSTFKWRPSWHLDDIFVPTNKTRKRR